MFILAFPFNDCLLLNPSTHHHDTTTPAVRVNMRDTSYIPAKFAQIIIFTITYICEFVVLSRLCINSRCTTDDWVFSSSTWWTDHRWLMMICLANRICFRDNQFLKRKCRELYASDIQHKVEQNGVWCWCVHIYYIYIY